MFKVSSSSSLKYFKVNLKLTFTSYYISPPTTSLHPPPSSTCHSHHLPFSLPPTIHHLPITFQPPSTNHLPATTTKPQNLTPPPTIVNQLSSPPSPPITCHHLSCPNDLSRYSITSNHPRTSSHQLASRPTISHHIASPVKFRPPPITF